MLKHQEVAQLLQEDIDQAKLPHGHKLPCLADLIQHYNVSKNTMMQALKNLESQHRIYQVQGSGIFVRRLNRSDYLPMFQNSTGFSGNFKDQMTRKLLSFEISTADDQLARELDCQIGDQVYHVLRLQTLEDKPFCLEESYYLADRTCPLDESIARHSIFSHIKKNGVKLGFSDKYLKVAALDAEQAAYLGTSPQSPALLMEEIYYLTDGRPFDFSRSLYRQEFTNFYAQSN